MNKMTLLASAVVLAGTVATLRAEHGRPPGDIPDATCACDCVDADGEIDPETGGPLLDDYVCCTDATDDPTFAGNGGLPCGCVFVDGVASVSGRISSDGVQGCIHVDYPPTGVGQVPGDSFIGSDPEGWWTCYENAVAACRLGDCTTMTFDAPECAGAASTAEPVRRVVGQWVTSYTLVEPLGISYAHMSPHTLEADDANGGRGEIRWSSIHSGALSANPNGDLPEPRVFTDGRISLDCVVIWDRPDGGKQMYAAAWTNETTRMGYYVLDYATDPYSSWGAENITDEEDRFGPCGAGKAASFWLYPLDGKFLFVP